MTGLGQDVALLGVRCDGRADRAIVALRVARYRAPRARCRSVRCVACPAYREKVALCLSMGLMGGEVQAAGACEGVQGEAEFVIEAAAAVSGVFNDHQPAARPPPVQRPCGVEWAGDVVAAVDKHRRYRGEVVHPGKDLAVGEEAAVAPVVGDQAREDHPEGRVLIARAGRPARHE